MPEFKRELKTYNVQYHCDACGSNDVTFDGISLLSNPPLYPHTCKSCGKSYTFKRKYPTIECIDVDSDVLNMVISNKQL